MSSPHDPEQDLSQTLARQADRLAAHGAPLQFDQVVARAGEIRRGRRMRASMVMAAVVLAVAVPVGITALGENDPTRKPATPAATATTTPDTSEIGLGEYRGGKAPRSGYTLDGTLFHDGREIPIGADSVSYLVRINGGFLVGQTSASDGTALRVIADDGNGTEQTWPFDGQGVAVSPDGSVAAFVDNDGTVIAVQDGGAQTYEVGTLPPGSYATVAVSGSDCSQEASDCSVWVVETDETSTTWRVSPLTGAVKGPVPAGLIDRDVAGNSVRQVSYDGNTGRACSAYLNPDQVEVWRSCEYRPQSFSPDGRYVLANRSESDGIGYGALVVLKAADGSVALDLSTVRVSEDGPMVTLYESVWEDAGHLLTTVQEGDSYGVLRVALDGSREYAVEPAKGDDPFGPAPIKLG